MYIENTSQEKRILNLLRKSKGKWVALPKILKLGIAQYNARIFGLRKKNNIIENKIKNIGKKRHTYFRLIKEPNDNT